MKRLLTLLCFCASLTSVAFADSPAGNGSTSSPAVCQFNNAMSAMSSGTSSQAACDAYGDLKLAPWSYFDVTTTGATTIKSGVGVFGGVFNLSTSAQPSSLCTIYDNTAASGNILFQENQIGANQQFLPPSPGILFLTGLTITCASAPTTGLLVEYK